MSTTTVSIEVPIEVADLVALFTKAERKRRTHKDILRNAYTFYADSVRRCLMCQSGSECPVHGTTVLRPDADNKPEKSEVDSQEFTLLRDIYFLLFAEVRREQPSFGAREGKALKDLLRSEGFERAKKVIIAAYGNEFWRGTATILTIARDPSRHLGEPQKKPQGGSLQRDSGYKGGEERR